MTETLIQKLINRPSITVYVNSSIQDLVQILNKNRVGCAVVIDIKSAFPVGIVSERDLIRNHDKIINLIQLNAHH